jgi:hypothetical protein
MSYGTYKGWSAETDMAEFFQELVGEDFHFERFGGVEFNKSTHVGDVGILKHCNKHKFHGEKEPNECIFDKYFIEVKARATPNVWKNFNIAEDNAKLYGKAGVIGCFKKQKKGQGKGEWLITLRPETFKRLFKK